MLIFPAGWTIQAGIGGLRLIAARTELCRPDPEARRHPFKDDGNIVKGMWRAHFRWSVGREGSTCDEQAPCKDLRGPPHGVAVPAT